MSSPRNNLVRSRAEKFEDEKRRIIDSCFMKREPDGASSESYITHIRIVEDAASPSAPPPQSSPAENKKSRAIIVSVRRSGRVRLHKARENNNGTFSIGKTWVLDHLTAIESFTGLNPTTYDEQQRKDRAGNTGVLITIQKPYFWQTVTPKEKDFFIGSLVKIYRKYTGGQEPQLFGFTAQELAEFSSPPVQRSKSSQPPSRPPEPTGGPKSFSSEYPLPASKGANGSYSRDVRPPSAGSSSTRGTGYQDRAPSLSGQSQQDDSRGSKGQESRSRFQTLKNAAFVPSPRPDGLRPSTPGDDQSARTLATESSVESSLGKQEARTPPSSLIPGDRFQANGSYSSLPHSETPSTPNLPPVPGPRSPDRRRVGSANNNASASPPTQDQLPERKRPPFLAVSASYKTSGRTTPASFATPDEQPSPVEPQEAPHFATEPPAQQAPTDYFLAANKRLNEQESKEPAPSEPEPEKQSDVKDTPTALSAMSSPSEPPSVTDTPEEYRPGLGPMIKKKKSGKEVATAFRKAAAAHNAFKPRAGGAAEKLRDELAKSPNTPDGINGVFPAPSREVKSPTADPTPPVSSTPTPEPLTIPSEPQPSVTAVVVEPPSELSTLKVPQATEKTPKKDDTAAVKEERRRKRPSNNSAKYAKALGIDPSALEGRTLEIESVLTDFGWGEEEKNKKPFEELQVDIKRELAKIETGSWLGSFEHNDERVATVSRLLDRAVSECEELDGLLTLYNVELGTLSEDVAYIEAQSQGLQVQTANQRLLQGELERLLDTISISSSQLRALKETSMNRPDGIQTIETALSQLYKAMLTIDPRIQHHGRPPGGSRLPTDENGSMDKIGTEISTMRAVREKKDGYQFESFTFIQRFKQFVTVKFREAEALTYDSFGQNMPLPSGSSKLDHHRRDQIRAGLWMYSPLVLFTREINNPEWEDLLRAYEGSVKRPYHDEHRNLIASWKRAAKKVGTEEQEALFTSQEKESDSLVARKLTVKRSKTLREGPRTPSAEKGQDGKILAYEAFAGILSDTSQSIFTEQNFVVDMFHLSSLSNAEFPDLVASTHPEARRGGNLYEKRLFDPDRSMAKRLKTMIDEMFSFWPVEVQNLVDWVVSQDPLQGVGVLLTLETRIADLEDSNQEYIVQILGQIHSRLTTRFDRFVEEQIRGIEDTKVKIKKRKGVIAFMKTFPYFASTVETMLAPPVASSCEVRNLVNEVYVKINKAMFESLKFIAKESPVVMAGQKAQGQTGGDAEDKEILNYHILLIENMNHYVEEVDVRGNPVLDEWKRNAQDEMDEHMTLYLNAVIRRPLGNLLDFLESTESLMQTAPDGPASISSRASHARPTFKKLLATYDAKEISRGIDQLKKRVVKHFGEADDPRLSQNLISKVLSACGARYEGVYDRVANVIAVVYGGEMDIEFKREDLQPIFKRF